MFLNIFKVISFTGHPGKRGGVSIFTRFCFIATGQRVFVHESVYIIRHGSEASSTIVARGNCRCTLFMITRIIVGSTIVR